MPKQAKLVNLNSGDLNTMILFIEMCNMIGMAKASLLNNDPDGAIFELNQILESSEIVLGSAHPMASINGPILDEDIPILNYEITPAHEERLQ